MPLNILIIGGVALGTKAATRARRILPDAEITVEGNPAAAGREALSVWRECGVNRLSLGSQSAQADELMVSFQGPSHAHAVRSMEILADAWELDPAEAAGAPGDWNEKR